MYAALEEYYVHMLFVFILLMLIIAHVAFN